MKKIELLAPAGNLEKGKAAVDHGADAVYMGAEGFGARQAAGNTLSDIEEMIRYAGKFRAGVYITLNTILFDNELDAVRKLIHRLHDMGAAALIVQDMALLEMDIPPIPLFASTQTHNHTPEKVRFLEDAGFERVILARELSLPQIAGIRKQTRVDLEFFAHGALCVSYSGQCYLSHAIGGRSANRGGCGQPCRLPWSLVDEKGNELHGRSHLLSLKDLNLSAHLPALVDAGISSFKIEGRLKDAAYVKNITAFYRRKLDALMEERKNLERGSSGTTRFFFTPDPEITFNRGYTDYFLKGRTKKITAWDSPKSLGKPVGKVTKKSRDWFQLDKGPALHNGDGLCFFDKSGRLRGLKVNRVEDLRIHPGNPASRDFAALEKGTPLFRNFDHEFIKRMKGKTAARTVALDLTLSETTDGFLLGAMDEDGFEASALLEWEKAAPNNPENADHALTKQLGKTGDTIFTARSVTLDLAAPRFIPPSALNRLRREVLEKLESLRQAPAPSRAPLPEKGFPPFPHHTLDHQGNVANRLAEGVYEKSGVARIDPAFEKQRPAGKTVVMTTRHCIRYSLGLCSRGEKNASPLFLSGEKGRFSLLFDCEKCADSCVMRVMSE